jgi:FKBP-type peptidyl-prolyl cis-trans isomerase 2
MKQIMKKFRNNKIINTYLLFFMFLCGVVELFSWVRQTSALANESGAVQAGDLVSVFYSLSLESGALVRTNIPELANNSAMLKAAEYKESVVSGPLTVLAGQQDGFPGVHDAILGMKDGETKRSIITPDEAYGPRSDDKVKSFSSVRHVPKSTKIPVKTFQEQYKSKPEKGDRLQLVPYFYHKVVEVTADEVLLDADLKDTLVSDDGFGKTRAVPESDSITITLEPKLGADFEADNSTGKIVSTGKDTFKVDFNNPLAGKTLTLETRVVSIIKAPFFKDRNITWHEDHDEGLNAAAKSGKPVVLALYADWCPWCKKLFSETFVDPRVTMLRDDFVWVKSNSDKDKSLKELYGQKDFPFIVLMNSNGKVINRLSGFKYAYDLRDELRTTLQKISESSGLKAQDSGQKE